MASALPFMEPLHVVGAGSIGLFLTSSLRSAFPSYPLALLFRGRHRGSVRFPSSNNTRTKEIVVCTRQLAASAGVDKGIARAPFKRPRPQLARVPYQFTDDYLQERRIRNLLVCTKAYQAEDAIRDLHQRLHTSQLRIFLFCNGALDVREKLQKSLQNVIDPLNLQLIMCMTTHGVIDESSFDGEDADMIDEMFHLLHVGQGKVFIGSADFCTLPIAQLFDQSGLSAQSLKSDQMDILLWKKLAANCVCNPLTALWDVPNGKLRDNPTFLIVRNEIISEVSAVATTLMPHLKDELGPSSLDAFVEEVISANMLNKSSMERDMRLGKKTEVENLNGYVVRKGTELGLGTMPANGALLDEIQDATSERSLSR